MSKRSALTRLRKILTYLYPGEADARRVTAEAELDQERIDFTGKAANLWQSILEEAVKQNKLPALIAIALEDYPGNQELVNAWEAYRAGTSAPAPPLSPFPPTPSPAARKSSPSSPRACSKATT